MHERSNIAITMTSESNKDSLSANATPVAREQRVTKGGMTYCQRVVQ